ncbi:hypothetical protein BBP40_000717 [Aspergillus hancockii]|nr:hypothetical protein BBP40_000717 [Aspergillus hancockii]
MSIFSTLFRSCLEGRGRYKRECNPPAVPPKDLPIINPVLSEKESELHKRPSIRIVEEDDDDDMPCQCGGFNGDIKSLVKVSEDTVVDVELDTKEKKDAINHQPEKEHKKQTTSNDNNPPIPEKPHPQPQHSKKLPDIKSRLIEDIPEETEPETSSPPEDPKTTVLSKDEKSIPAWRLSRRKSLIEIINLLQATAASAPKLSNIRLPVIPPKSPLRSRASATSLSSSVSSVTVTEEAPPKTKKERRMGAVMFPGVRFGTKKWGAEESASMAPSTTTRTAIGKEKPLFC